MSDPTCATCQRPDPTRGTVCPDCAGRARRSLATIADLCPDARDVAHGQARRGPAIAGGSGGRLPLNLAAGARLDALQNALTGWARVVAAERGLPLPTGPDPLETAARWLTEHVEWLRHQQYGPEAFAVFAAAERVITGLVDAPGTDRRYLGPCRAELDDGDCDADVYGRAGSSWATCRTCGATHDVAARRAWLDAEVRQHAFTASEIESAYGVAAGTIRVWANRGRVTARGSNRRGWPLYPLGEVLDLAAADAARRATAQARQKRRAEERASEDDGPRPEGEAA